MVNAVVVKFGAIGIFKYSSVLQKNSEGFTIFDDPHTYCGLHPALNAMFKPFWGAQQYPAEPSFPNASAQSWYPPAVLPPLTGTGCPPIPNNLSQAGLNPYQRAGAVTNTIVDSRPQSPSYSQLSPAAENIYSLLRDRSVDELQAILTDKEAYNKVLHSIGEVKHLVSLRDDLRMKTIHLARKNLEKASQIGELRNQCTIIRTTELAVAQEKIDELEKKEKELARLAPASLLEKLKDAANGTDEESENLQHLLLAGEIELTEFIQNYRSLRTLYHWRMLLRLAATSSVPPV